MACTQDRIRTLFLGLIFVTASPALVGCAVSTDDRDLQWVTVNEAQQLTEHKGFALTGSKTMVYVDPRTTKDFAAGHVPGAVLVPFGDLRMSGIPAQLDTCDVVVVYDSDYEGLVAAAASKQLIELDKWDVYTMKGGLKAWEKSGNEVAYGMPESAGDGDGVAQEAVAKPQYGRAKKSAVRTGK